MLGVLETRLELRPAADAASPRAIAAVATFTGCALQCSYLRIGIRVKYFLLPGLYHLSTSQV
jgi:hypothetical protein